MQNSSVTTMVEFSSYTAELTFYNARKNSFVD